MAATPQTYANHAKFVPLYHGVAFSIFAINFFWSLWILISEPSARAGFSVLMAVALIILFFAARVFALTVQDRVIRLEMRLRMKEVLPVSMHPRIGEFSKRQLVALRFASDAELPALAEKVLHDNIQDTKAIKRMVKDWQADHWRA
jgi:hypothetical protein